MPAPAQFTLFPENTHLLDLDPKLQNVILGQRRLGIPGLLSPPRSARIPVVLRVKSLPIPELSCTSSVSDTDGMTLIAAGDIEAGRIEAVRNHPDVVSLKLAQPVVAVADVAEVGCAPAQLASAVSSVKAGGITGAGVIVGIIDAQGFDCVHPNFRNADGTTRLLTLWDQEGSGNPPQPYGYGREFQAVEINKGLSSCPPGNPICQTFLQSGVPVMTAGHGTAVSDVAAGNGGVTASAGTQSPGVAPQADIIFVSLSDDAISGETDATWRHVIDALDYIFKEADRRHQQAVVNLSLECRGGSHDDTSLIERAFNGFLSTNGRAIVVAAGNSRQEQLHAAANVTATAPLRLPCLVDANATMATEIELWYPGTDALSVFIISPTGDRLGPVALGDTQGIRLNGAVAGRVMHRQTDPNNSDNLIEVVFGTTLSGAWTIELTSACGRDVPFHAWIGGSNAVFTAHTTTASTVNGMASSAAICVGAHTTGTSHTSPSMWPGSGEGPTRAGELKPDVVAPGCPVPAAAALRVRPRTVIGTSIATPFVTGLVALMMEAAGGRILSATEIRKILVTHSRGGGKWGSATGYGQVDGASSIAAV